MQTKTVYKLIFLSGFFTFLSYVNCKIQFSEMGSVWDLIKTGYPQARTLFLSNNFFKDYPYVFVILFWSVVGFTMYLLYFSVNLIYRNIRNWEVIEKYYTKPAHVEGFHLNTFLKRTSLHLAVVFTCLVFLLVMLLVIIPVTKSLYLATKLSPEILNNIPIFILWLVVFSLFTLVLYLIDGQMRKEETEEEHGLAEVENIVKPS